MTDGEAAEKARVESDDEIRAEMRQNYVIPGDDIFLEDLDKTVVKVAGPYQACFKAFRQNLASAILTAGMPFTLSTAAVINRHLLGIRISEGIRSLKIGTESVREGETLEEARKRVAADTSQRRFAELMDSAEGQRQLGEQTRDLLRELPNYNLAGALRELLRQGLVLVWSAIEVLARDTFETLLNAEPQKVSMLMCHPDTRRRFEAERLPLDTVVQHGFNLSSQLGSILIEQQDFSDFPTVKAVYSVLFPTSTTLRESLSSKDLWVLYQRRHVIVHRAGIVDHAYLKATGEAIAAGNELVVTAPWFETAVGAAVGFGTALASEFRA